jgi:hypothetical protein
MTVLGSGGHQGLDRTRSSSARHCSSVITGGLPMPQPMPQTPRGKPRRHMNVMNRVRRLPNFPSLMGFF